jgi:predicted metal-dependent hydrolase
MNDVDDAKAHICGHLGIEEWRIRFDRETATIVVRVPPSIDESKLDAFLRSDHPWPLTIDLQIERARA